MLAIVFAADDVLAPTGALRAGGEPGRDRLPAVQELVRPADGALHVLRELEGLGLGMALFGEGPDWLVRRIAQVVWFRGDVVVAAGPGRFAELCARVDLPPPCIWYVTASEADAAAAHAAGTNVVLFAPGAAPALHEPDERGLFVAAALSDVLEIIRIPYTRSALNLRYVLRKILDAPSVDELVR